MIPKFSISKITEIVSEDLLSPSTQQAQRLVLFGPILSNRRFEEPRDVEQGDFVQFYRCFDGVGICQTCVMFIFNGDVSHLHNDHTEEEIDARIREMENGFADFQNGLGASGVLFDLCRDEYDEPITDFGTCSICDTRATIFNCEVWGYQ